MYSKYFLIIQEYGAKKPFVTFLEFEDANEALDVYYDYVEDEKYDVVLYRRLKHDYSNL